MQTVEAGVQVFPGKYGSSAGLRLFIYYTADNYGANGCYNLDCGVFSQVNKSVNIGGGFNVYSQTGGPQYDSRFDLERNSAGDWWFGYNGTWIGFWPNARFAPGTLGGLASYGHAGGEIVNDESGGQHTITQMGSGTVPCETNLFVSNACANYSDFGNVDYQRRLVQFNSANQWSYLPTAGGTSTNAYCYSYAPTQTSDSNWGNFFYFGGPGRSTLCP